MYENRVPLIRTVLVTGKQGIESPHLPMTEIAGNNAKRVLSREKWRDKLPELSFRLAIYCTNKDRNDGYIQPTATVSLELRT